MRRWTEVVGGDPVSINRVETVEDLDEFEEFVRNNLRALACDTETTSANMYEPDFRVRLMQFGNRDTAYVLPVEHKGPFLGAAVRALLGVETLLFHNAMFDLQVIERLTDILMETLWPNVLDTQILCKLIDPRPTEAGGTGNSLEDATRYYIDPIVAEDVKGLMTRLAKEHKTTKARIFSTIDLDHPEYNRYAGMDAILTARLASILPRKVPNSSKPLIDFEHEVAEVCGYMARTGFLLDVEYTEDLSAELRIKEAHHKEVADSLGVEKVNSGAQVAEGLLSHGAKLTELTPAGNLKVDKVILDRLIADGGKAGQLAMAVKEAKKAGKWRTTWVDTFLATKDEHDRCHASINPLQARTGRMSITGIPAQTLPSGDWMIRRCFISDPGEVIASVDYQAQELRVLAALARDEVMIEAFRNNADLHLLTARAAFGDHIQKDDPERKYAKTVNFGRVYGGGAKTVAAQTGIDLATAKRVVEGFDRAYPGVTRYSRRLQDAARRDGHVVTPSGRRLPVDPARAYSALNYMVQSTSRDVTCRGLIKMHAKGITPYLRLPIHDEVVASLPEDRSDRAAAVIAELMAEEMGPVYIGTDPEVGGRSWGSLYMKREEWPHLDAK